MLFKPATAFAIIALFFASPAVAWDGTDTETGASIEIESGNLVRQGNDIEIYDQDAGEYHDVSVEGISRFGSSVEIDVYDNNTGEYRTLEFDDNDQ